MRQGCLFPAMVAKACQQEAFPESLAQPAYLKFDEQAMGKVRQQ
jgi:hypothetical protein